MAPIIVRTEVDRPAADVFAYATDPTRFPEWQKGVVEGHMDQPGTPMVGARCSTTRRIGLANRLFLECSTVGGCVDDAGRKGRRGVSSSGGRATPRGLP
jgi:Polyketide cyclase / dehydrase and lipid transport